MTQIKGSIPTPTPRPLQTPGTKPNAPDAAPPKAPRPQTLENNNPTEKLSVTKLPGRAEAPHVDLSGDAAPAKGARKTRAAQSVSNDAPPSRSARVSAYGPGLYGNKTANGTRLTPNTVGLAHKSLPLGSRVDVTVNGRTVSATVIDRGPYVGNREFDLTNGLIKELGFANCSEFGVRSVSVRVHR
ncbi:MAG: septal ring lytic transglycosylase RlpA family protein [Candidatus Sericytochromatia bacterium]